MILESLSITLKSAIGLCRRPVTGALSGLLILVSIAGTANAQSPAASAAEDPVSRAMKAINSAVEPRASDAGYAIEAARLVRAGKAARERGERAAAIELLKRAAA